jgi:hypothetical protein
MYQKVQRIILKIFQPTVYTHLNNFKVTTVRCRSSKCL